jgi:FAD:protein FMN transferase
MRCSPDPDRRIARAEVWLGTLVEIALPSEEATDARFVAGFAAIAHVHRRMSAHDPASDLGRIARGAHRRAIVVDRETYAVLELALELWRSTQGLFDVTVAPCLAEEGLLPAHAAGMGARCARMSALRLESGFRVRAECPIAVDLGGIAKGHAVDCAVAALREAGARAGVVNAGGDLRAFGAGDWTPVRVRHPARPAVAIPLLDLREAAVATSGDYFRGGAMALVDPRTRALRPYGTGVTVVAPTCVLADALTKIVALDAARAPSILRRFGAEAFRLDADAGQLHATTTCAASTPFLRLPLPLAA